MKSKERRVGELGLFAGCRPDELRWICRVADELDVPAGGSISSAGARVREFVVIIDGFAASDDGKVLGAGAHVGEIQLLGGSTPACGVEALTTVRALVFDARAFNGLLARAPSVARKLMRELVERVAA